LNDLQITLFDEKAYLIMFASGVLHSSPRAARVSSMRCDSLKPSGNCDIILAASEMSHCSTSIPALDAKVLTIGSKLYVARAGASSVTV
jgi:hypothetical protein